MKTHLRRSLAAVLTALACLALMANPAAAVTHDAVITGGQLTFTKTGITPVVLDLVPHDCVTDPTSQLDITGTSVSVTAIDMRSLDFLYPATTGLLSVFTWQSTLTTAGTLTGTTLTGLRLTMRITIYSTGGSCTPTGTPVCTLAMILDLSGTLTGTTTSSTFSLTGSSPFNVATNPTCTAGPSYIVGAAVAVTSPITGHLTS